jgi:hypothetical protein
VAEEIGQIIEGIGWERAVSGTAYSVSKTKRNEKDAKQCVTGGLEYYQTKTSSKLAKL